MGVNVSMEIEGIEEFKAAMAKLDSGMQSHVFRQLVDWAEDVKALAQRYVPVRTGYLRSRIFAIISGWVARIGADATYAMFVELGTRYMRAHPYLYPAIQTYLRTLEAIICEGIEAARQEAGL